MKQRDITNNLDASEALLNETDWTNITIQDIVERSETSVGSLYARFKNKNVLLTSLSSRFSDDAKEEAENIFELSKGLEPKQVIQLMISELIKFHHQRKGIIRTLAIIPRLEKSNRLRADGLRNTDIFEDLVALLTEITNNPSLARVSLFIVSNAIREAVIFPEIAQYLIDIDHQSLAKVLSRVICAYLED